MSQTLDKPASFFDTFARKPAQQGTTHYCPGCGHGILHKLLAEAISDLGIQDTTLLVGPVGCGVFFYYYFECASVSSAHGRASAVATGVSRSNPDGITVSYQGDGDLAAIGTNNAIHAANRGENMLVLFVNNNIYGMTGGQLAPTTLIGQKTTTSPYGRSVENDGPPLRVAEIIATLDAPALVARVAVNNPKNIRTARRVLRKGLQAQIDRKGYVFIEVLSQCPTNWRKSPAEACTWIDEVVTKSYPLGIIRDDIDNREPAPRTLGKADFATVADLLDLAGEEAAPAEGGMLPYPEVHFKSAGFGGQGVLSLGLILAHAAMKKGFEVTWLPSYGPEMRGGVANCSVVVGTEPIGTPVVDNPNILVAMNKPSLAKFGPIVPPDGVVVYNSSLIDTVPDGIRAPLHAIEATDLARALGNVKTANTIVLGYLARLTGLFTLDELNAFLKDYFTKPGLYELNIPALQKGWDQAGADES